MPWELVVVEGIGAAVEGMGVVEGMGAVEGIEAVEGMVVAVLPY